MIRYYKTEQSKIENGRSLYQIEKIIKIFSIIIYKSVYYSDYPKSDNKQNSPIIGYQSPKPLIKID